MPISTEKYIGLVYRDPSTHELNLFYPKTVGVQVEIEGSSGVTVQDHANSNSHLTRLNKEAFRNMGGAGGLCVLDPDGFISLDNMPPGMAYIKIDHANITDLLADDRVHANSLVFVYDASGDPTVESGWAVYKRTEDPDYTDLDVGWAKIAENEALDLEISWEALQAILPNSSPEDIDEMVSLMHDHDNLDTIDGITADADGEHFSYKGQQVALRSDVNHWLFGDYYHEDDIDDGDVWVRTVSGQSWWYDPSIEYAWTSCYQKYANNQTLVSAPKLRTSDVTTFRRMFYNDRNLEEIPMYDFSKALDIGGFIQEATKITTVPYMNTYKCKTFDYVFSGATNLEFGPVMYMGKATSAVGMFSGCGRLTEVYDLGSTENLANMKDMFNGCYSLKRIESALDFSAVENPSAVVNMFNGCINLSYLRFVPDTLKVSISLEGTNLSVESLVSVFEGLSTYVGNPDNAPVINITGIEAVAYLTQEQKNIALNKGWKIDDSIDTYEVSSAAELDKALASIGDGDSIALSGNVDTIGHAIDITKNGINLVIGDDLTTDGSRSSGINITNGSATISGEGIVVNDTPYSRNNASGIITVNEGGELTFNGSGISATIEDDPVNKGQFGVCVYGDGKLTVNDGTFDAGWYCISGNGSTTSAESVVEINGGKFTSAADYVIYHPHAGTLNINGGTFTGAAGALAVNNGTVTITDGEFVVTGGGDTGDWPDGTSGLAEATINLNARYGDVTCIITGGKFSNLNDTPLIKIGTTHNVDLQISGGKFKTKPNAEWIADGYACMDTPDEDGFYEVIKDF